MVDHLDVVIQPDVAHGVRRRDAVCRLAVKVQDRRIELSRPTAAVLHESQRTTDFADVLRGNLRHRQPELAHGQSGNDDTRGKHYIFAQLSFHGRPVFE